MTAYIKNELSMTIDRADMAAILNDHFCDGYSAFRKLTVDMVAMDDSGDFDITFVPKPEPAEPEA